MYTHLGKTAIGFIIVVAALGMALISPNGGWAQARVSAGYDLFTTDPDTTDLLGIPFVGDAGARPTFDFVPPPDSADGRRAIGDTDTIVHRLEDAVVESVPGTADPITIELVLLRLVSAEEFDVDGDGMSDGHLFVTLQKDRDPAGEPRMDFDQEPPPEEPPPDEPPADMPPGGLVEETVFPGPRSFGEMTITFTSTAGGSFESELLVYADLRLGSGDGPIVCGVTAGLPACEDMDAGLELGTTETAFWSRNPLPDSITIRGVNFSLAAPDRNEPEDLSADFRAGVNPDNPITICVAHGGHPDPQGAPTAHGTCFTPCTTSAIEINSCSNGVDDNCNGLIDECDEDLFGPSVTAPPSRTLECAKPQVDTGTGANGFATATDNCSPPTLPPTSIAFSDFITYRCGPTFDLDRVWTAIDNCGNTAAMPDLQQIFVVDTTDPEITFCPAAATILWTDDRTPAALGEATGADSCSEDEKVGIADDDATVFGTCLSEEITRTWTATDECANASSCDQPISVRGPKDAIEDLDAVLAGLGSVDPKFRETLSRKLSNAVDSACAGNATSTSNQLEAFINQVAAQIGKKIDPTDAKTLIDGATAIIEALALGGACPPDSCEGPTPPPPPPPPTVIIGGCDTGVPNVTLPDGRTLQETLDAACPDPEDNRYSSCIAQITNELQRDGLITGMQKGKIQSCAGGN
jgi:hypothetical protein